MPFLRNYTAASSLFQEQGNRLRQHVSGIAVKAAA